MTCCKNSANVGLQLTLGGVHAVEPQGRSGYFLWQVLFVCVGGARREKGCNHLVYLDNFFRQ